MDSPPFGRGNIMDEFGHGFQTTWKNFILWEVDKKFPIGPEGKEFGKGWEGFWEGKVGLRWPGLGGKDLAHYLVGFWGRWITRVVVPKC